jgi:hypothetical protein
VGCTYIARALDARLANGDEAIVRLDDAVNEGALERHRRAVLVGKRWIGGGRLTAPGAAVVVTMRAVMPARMGSFMLIEVVLRL